MSLVDELRKQISDLHKTHHATLTEVRGNHRLTTQGKAEAIRESFDQTRGQVDKLRTDATASAAARGQQLKSSLFGVMGDVSSYRSAQDRVAAAKTAGQLGEIMQQAHEAGDQEVVRAGFARAWQQASSTPGNSQWRFLVDEYGRENGVTDKVAELDDLTAITSPAGKLRDGIEAGLPTPAELRPGYRPLAPGPIAEGASLNAGTPMRTW